MIMPEFVKKTIIFQIVILVLLFFTSWFWFGDAISSLGYTVASIMFFFAFNIGFEYVWSVESQT